MRKFLVIANNSDWFIAPLAPVVIGAGFSTVIWKPLYVIVNAPVHQAFQLAQNLLPQGLDGWERRLVHRAGTGNKTQQTPNELFGFRCWNTVAGSRPHKLPIKDGVPRCWFSLSEDDCTTNFTELRRGDDRRWFFDVNVYMHANHSLP